MGESTGMRILVADDETEIRRSLQEILVEEGHEVVEAQSEKDALAGASRGVDLVILDVKLGSDDGIEVLRKLRTEYAQVPVIMITGFGTVALAKQAFKLGAHDFLEKPLRLLQVRTCVRNALEGVRLRKQIEQHEKSTGTAPIYVSQPMVALLSQAARLAQIREPVVLLGPSGSGKELLARYLHAKGPRAHHPFIATNAASMPVTLAEDELFGHERGAFTGADKRREGCLERAHGGTLFLDEIADMDPQIQAKLLRVLENGEVSRIGASESITVDVRLVCATHKDIDTLISQGTFRHDLWYRISAFVLRIPGLESRTEDIPLLANHFLNQMNAQLGVSRSFSAKALDHLKELSFPGNVRQLKHLIARVAVYSDNVEIGPQELDLHIGDQPLRETGTPAATPQSYASLDFRAARIAFERDFLDAALKRNDGNITAAARAIGMAQSNLSRKLKELGL